MERGFGGKVQSRKLGDRGTFSTRKGRLLDRTETDAFPFATDAFAFGGVETRCGYGIMMLTSASCCLRYCCLIRLTHVVCSVLAMRRLVRCGNLGVDLVHVEQWGS